MKSFAKYTSILIMSVSLYSTGLLMLASPASAISCKGVPLSIEVNCSQSGNPNPLIAYIASIVRFFSGIFGILIVISIIVSGIQYITASDSQERFKKAKGRLINAVIGLILFIMMVGILNYLIPGVFS